MSKKLGLVRPSRALLSLFDKTRLEEIAAILRQHDIALIASSGTAAALAKAGFSAEKVEALTGWPEMLGGRVKTLHPKIHGGILARRDAAQDKADMARHEIAPIDVLLVGLYPFEDGLTRGEKEAAQIELIDIGAPAMVRGAAKNHAHVVVLASEEDIPLLAQELEAHKGATSLAFRRRMAARAFAHTAYYDAMIANWMAGGQDTPPERMLLAGRKREVLRYGENPHQQAALYAVPASTASEGGLAAAPLLQGKPLSFNNLTDAQAAYALVQEFPNPACAIIKHANPCGIACGKTALQAWEKAFAADEQSAFGGIVAFNCPLDEKAAHALKPVFLELVLAPAITPAAREVLAGKKNLRLLALPERIAPAWEIKPIGGGFVLQSPDAAPLPEPDWQCVSKKKASAQDEADLLFAWRACRHVKSNAVLLALNEASVGIGAGQMSRVDASQLAVQKAGGRAKGAVAASDAFFPFADGLEVLARAGIRAVIQPGGSMRDEEVIAAADKAGMVMIFSGQRHFKH